MARPRHVLIVDKQEYWRTLSAKALNEAGYIVDILDSYAYPNFGPTDQRAHPDLVILGCSTIGPEEQELIGHVLEKKHRLLVFSTALPWHLMRSLFLLGAADVADKSFQPEYLVRTVGTVLQDTDARSAYDQATQEESP